MMSSWGDSDIGEAWAQEIGGKTKQRENENISRPLLISSPGQEDIPHHDVGGLGALSPVGAHDQQRLSGVCLGGGEAGGD